MDPLSVTASVIAILDLTSKLKSYIIDVKQADAEQGKLLAEISQLHGLLTSLRYRVQAAPAGDAWLNQIKLLAQERGPLDQFREALEEIVKRLPGPTKLEKFKATITWTWDKKHTVEVLQRIERLKTLVLCALAEDISTLTQLILEDTRHLGAQMKQLDSRTAELQMHSNQELQHRIVQWLGIPDPSVNYHNALKKRQPNTGQWLLNGADFSQWQNESGALMWLHGNAGCGKTVLSAAALEYLLRLRHTNPSIVVVYFYFDFNDTRKQQVDKMIQSILFQVAQQTDDGQDALRRLYERCGSGQQQPPPATVAELMCNTLCTTGSTYFVLDALDECTECNDLLDFLSDLAQRKITGLRILATSRREWDIEQPLRLISDFNINIQSATVDDDIRTYIEARLVTDTKLRKWPENVRTEILEELMKKADGMFRWAYCQLESIRLCVRLQKLREALKSLPKTLDETYERMLQQLESDGHITDALTVLRWLCYSDRPLSLPEIIDVLAIDTFHGTGFSPDERLPEPMEIMVICSSLITTYANEGLADDDNDIMSILKYESTDSPATMIRLAHFSVKEYLLSTRCAFKPDLDALISHRNISEASLHYLLFVAEQGPLDDTVATEYPLAEYAAEHWWHHMHNGQDECTPDMISLVLGLMSNDNTPLLCCIQLHDPDNPWAGFGLSRESSDIAPLLYYVALAGLVDVVSALLDRGADVDAAGGKYGNALQAASVGGHKAIVQQLLDKGADVNGVAGLYGNGLQAASAGGHEVVVQQLLGKGADVNAAGGHYGNALRAASEEGHVAVVRQLLDEGANIDAPGGQGPSVHNSGGHYATALQVVLVQGHEALVRHLLDRGADVNAPEGYYGTALHAASQRGQESMVRLLLDRGANINTLGSRCGSALLVASARGHEAVVQLLLDRHADVNADRGLHGTALQAASGSGHEAVVRLLLNRGANVNAQEGLRGSSLLVASARGHEVVVQLLLDRHADVNANNSLHGTALQAASGRGREAVVRLLLNRGANVNAQGGLRGSALQAASGRGHEAVRQLLLAAGAGSV